MKAINIVGQVFTRWTVLAQITENRKTRCFCKCLCGVEKWTAKAELIRRASKSCGCLKKELVSKRMKKDSPKTKDHLYWVWYAILTRCERPRYADYKYYGAKGVKLYEPWSTSFELFKEYIVATIGLRPDPTYTLDRINTYGNYEPGNVQWAGYEQQALNRRNVIEKRCNGLPTYVYLTKSNKFRVNYKRKHLGTFGTLESALARLGQEMAN